MENTEQRFQNRPDASLDSRRLLAKAPLYAAALASAIFAGMPSERANSAQGQISIKAGEALHPSIANGMTAIRRMIAEQSNGVFELRSFEKTNGIQISPQQYEMEYVIRLAVRDDAKMGVSFFATTCPSIGRPAGPAYINSRMLQKGTGISIKGSLKFVKTEKGWRQEKDEDLEYLTAYENAHKPDCDRIPPRVSENQK